MHFLGGSGVPFPASRQQRLLQKPGEAHCSESLLSVLLGYVSSHARNQSWKKTGRGWWIGEGALAGNPWILEQVSRVSSSPAPPEMGVWPRFQGFPPDCHGDGVWRSGDPGVLDCSVTQHPTPCCPHRDKPTLDCGRGPGSVLVRGRLAARLLGPAVVFVQEDQTRLLPGELPAAAPEGGRPGMGRGWGGGLSLPASS